MTQKTPIGYALHIVNSKHRYCPINNTMTLLKTYQQNFTIITIGTTIYPLIPPTQAAYFRTIHR
jgi:hypothetical protein